jgi:hypothetical protein
MLALAPALVPSGSQAVVDSTFNTQDGNLVADPSPDWASVSEIRQPDLATGASDDSFGNGTKEDTAVPTITDGSIPNNKSDLKTFGVYFEQGAQGRFLHLFWHRVQEPTGTTNMDFEFNQSSTLSSNGVTPVRTGGDMLIQYDLSQGGVNPVLSLSRWVTSGAASQCEASNKLPCWDHKLPLTGDAVGSINTVALQAADTDGLGNVSVRTFGEATIDFDAIAPSAGCNAFAYAYLKSRSSDSFTAAVKDFIAPVNPHVNTCGALKIHKTHDFYAATAHPSAQSGVQFAVTKDGTALAGRPFTTNGSGDICITGLEQGSYRVTEVVPDGYEVTTANPQDVPVNGVGDCTSGAAVANFHNRPKTDIAVSATSEVTGGTASTISCTNGAGSVATPTGSASLSTLSLAPGTYVCTITVLSEPPPAP